MSEPTSQSTSLKQPRLLRNALLRLTQTLHRHTRHGLMLAGLGVLFVILALVSQTNLRLGAEELLLDWLRERQDQRLTHNDGSGIPQDPLAADRVTALLTHELPKSQAALTRWIAKTYRVAPDAVAPLVAEAYALGAATQIDPTLTLAVMAVESRFNPMAQSAVGAQGLMQVLTRVHSDKYQAYGGRMAAFDPITNLRVGVQVLQDCIKRAGSLEGGLKLYVGAVSNDGQFYIDKVFATQRSMARVVGAAPLHSQGVAAPQAIGATVAVRAPVQDTAASEPVPAPSDPAPQPPIAAAAQ